MNGTKRTLVGIAMMALALVWLKMRRRRFFDPSSSPSTSFIVTGAASGIGRHLTDRLLSKGHKVLATDLNYDALSSFYDENWRPHGSRCIIKKQDVQSLEQWQEMVDCAVQNFGSLDVLLNVAGYIQPGDAYQVDKRQIDIHLDVNAKGMIIGSQIAAQQMIKQKHGHIINFASLAGVFFVPGISIYSASKHAVRGFTRALAFELLEHNVQVTCVCPDAVQTPMLDKQISYKQAALTFSSPQCLTVYDIEKEIFENVLPFRPHEVCIPHWKGAASAFQVWLPDNVLTWVVKILSGQGKAAQSEKAKLEKVR